MAKKKTYILLTFLVIVAFFCNNGALNTDIMESRNIVTAREMLSKGNFLVPTMNGEVRLEKPPLPTWAAALAESVSPFNMPLQRSMAGIMAVLAAVYLFLFARKFLRQDGVTAVLVLITCYNFVLQGRTATWDIYCHAFCMAAIYHICSAFWPLDVGGANVKSPKRRLWKHSMAAALWLALSIMSKGPVSLYALLLPFLLVFFYEKRPRMRSSWGAFGTMFLVALLLGGLWFAYVRVVAADDMHRIALKESSSWLGHNVRPVWYYATFFSESGVWAAVLLSAILLPLVKKLRRFKGVCFGGEYRFVWLWTVMVVLLLSLMPEKKMRYLLPMLLPASLLIAEFLRFIGGQRRFRWLLIVNAALLGLAFVGAPVALVFLAKGNNSIDFPFVIILLTGVAAAYFTLLGALHGSAKPMAWAVAAVFCALETCAMGRLTSVFKNPEMRSIALTRSDARLRSLPFYHKQGEELRIELVCAAGKSILPLDVASSDSVRKRLPLVLLTHKSLKEELPEGLLNAVDTLYIGTFDDNKHPKTDKHWSGMFRYRLTVLRAKD